MNFFNNDNTEVLPMELEIVIPFVVKETGVKEKDVRKVFLFLQNFQEGQEQ